MSDVLSIRHLITETTGLSRARNIGLDAIAGDVVGFPDDDCWYPEGVLATVRRLFSEKQNYALICGQYTEPGVRNPSFPADARQRFGRRVLDLCNSVTLFVRAPFIVKQRMMFDVNIGAGTSIPAGEETDFALRAILAGAKAIYDPDLVVYHSIRRDLQNRNFVAQRELARGYVFAKNSRDVRVAVRMWGGLGRLIFDAGRGQSTWWRVGARIRGIFLATRKLRPADR